MENAWLLGYGTVSFSRIIDNYLPPHVPRYGHPHNTYLQILYMYGVVGLTLYLGIIGGILSKAKFDKVVYCGVLVFVINSFFEQVWLNYNFIVLLFLIVGTGFYHPHQSRLLNP